MESLKTSMGYLTGRAAAALKRRLRQNFQEAGIPLTPQQFQILVQLHLQDGQTQQTIADRLCKEKSSITRLIDNMQKSGYLVRIPSEKDRRINQIHLTAEGRKIIDPCKEIARKTLHEAESGIPEEQLAVCKAVLAQLFDNLQEKHIIQPE